MQLHLIEQWLNAFLNLALIHRPPGVAFLRQWLLGFSKLLSCLVETLLLGRPLLLKNLATIRVAGFLGAFFNTREGRWRRRLGGGLGGRNGGDWIEVEPGATL